MGSIAAGELVTVATAGPPIDGIVFDTPSPSKVVVVVFEAKRGPVLRTVRPEAVSERETEGPHDRAMRLLIKRTPPPDHRHGHAGSAGGRGRAGHTRGASHRTSDH